MLPARSLRAYHTPKYAIRSITGTNASKQACKQAALNSIHRLTTKEEPTKPSINDPIVLAPFTIPEYVSLAGRFN